MSDSSSNDATTYGEVVYALAGIIALVAAWIILVGYPAGGEGGTQWERNLTAFVPLVGAALVVGGKYTEKALVKWSGAVLLFAFSALFLFGIGYLFLFPVGLLLLALAVNVHLEDKYASGPAKGGL